MLVVIPNVFLIFCVVSLVGGTKPLPAFCFFYHHREKRAHEREINFEWISCEDTWHKVIRRREIFSYFLDFL